MLIIIVGIISAAIVGVLVDWLLKLWLPTNPKVKHIIAGILAVTVFLGFSAWPSISDSSRTDILIQEGEIIFKSAGTHEGYYPTIYASPPNLVFEYQPISPDIEIVEQRSDGFKIRTVGGFAVGSTVGWKASGHPIKP